MARNIIATNSCYAYLTSTQEVNTISLCIKILCLRNFLRFMVCVAIRLHIVKDLQCFITLPITSSDYGDIFARWRVGLHDSLCFFPLECVLLAVGKIVDLEERVLKFDAFWNVLTTLMSIEQTLQKLDILIFL